MQIGGGILTVAALMMAACGEKPEASRKPALDSAGMAGIPMAMRGVQMMPMMQAHVDSLGTLAPAQMAAMMAAHEDLASRMMDAMGADMRGMSMQPDSAWAALSDSLKRDLADLPGLTDGALTARMQAHIGRMRRMMAMHEGMMRM